MTTTSPGSCGGEGGRVAVREREHDRVVAGEHLERGVLEQPVGERGEVRVDAAERLAGVRGAVRAPTSSSGCWSRRRSTSPPAYPLAPATATRLMCMTIQSSMTPCMHAGASTSRRPGRQLPSGTSAKVSSGSARSCDQVREGRTPRGPGRGCARRGQAGPRPRLERGRPCRCRPARSGPTTRRAARTRGPAPAR